jgi:hypothetical protein
MWPSGAAGSSHPTSDQTSDETSDDVSDDASDLSVGSGVLGAQRGSPGLPGRGVMLGALGLLAALVVVVVAVVVWGNADEEPALQPVIPVDAWAPYWALDRSADEISLRDGSMREVSPFWFRAVGVDQIIVDPNASADLTEDFLDNADDALVVPSIVDGLAAGEMAAIINDPQSRRRHVDAIVEFVADGGYDGVDLNYEQFAFADGRDSWEATRPNWVLLVSELAEDLHADGRTLTVSVPVVYDAGRTSDSGFWVYDYSAIVDHVDIIRIMAYDYSVGDPGPIAPLSFVQRAIDGAIEATGRPDKLSLGLAMYGRNWPVSVTGDCPEPGNEDGVTVPGVTTVTPRSVDDLIERRDAVPVYDAVTAEWSFEYELEISDSTTTCVQTRQVHYVDAEGVRARMDLAIAAGLGGVALWALGFEDDDVWDAILIDATLPGSDIDG